MQSPNQALELLARILRECPDRRPTSASERRAQELLATELDAAGCDLSWQSFRFNDSLYAHLALHFGMGTLGTLVSPLAPGLALALHGLAATSFWAESTQRGYLLRRALPWRRSQNLLAVLPSRGPRRLRLVVLAHADAALTGWLFSPTFTKHMVGELPRPLRFLRRPLDLAWRGQVALCGIDLLRLLLGPLTWPLRPLECALTLPSLLAFVLNLQVVLRDESVPGANDDLSGVVALPVLAHRFAQERPAGLEIVFGVTGCEEPAFGGATALAEAMRNEWDPTDTVVLALDGIGAGELGYLESEGELWPRPVPQEIVDAAQRAAHGVGMPTLPRWPVPVGGTDLNPFLLRGYPGLALVSMDPQLKTPPNYHQTCDTAEALDPAVFSQALDLTSALMREIAAQRGCA